MTTRRLVSLASSKFQFHFLAGSFCFPRFYIVEIDMYINNTSRYIAKLRIETMDALIAFSLGLPSRRKRSSSTKKKKKKADNYFETLTTAQLKDMCKAGKLKQSGTKAELCQRLLENEFIRPFIWCTQNQLKAELKEQMLVQSGSKYEQILRLIHHKYGTGQVKRAATDTVTDESGETKQVLKKRKINPKPETMYTRIEKKIKSVQQKKYQTNQGSKRHACDVFDMLETLMDEYCIKSGVLKNDPMLAFRIAKSGWSAIYDFWQYFERLGYASREAQKAMALLQFILFKVKETGLLSKDDVEEMVVVLENSYACFKDYGLHRGPSLKEGVSITDEPPLNFYGSNFYAKYDYLNDDKNMIEETIRIIMEDYDPKSRPKGKNKSLECDIRGFCALNGIPYPPNKK